MSTRTFGKLSGNTVTGYQLVADSGLGVEILDWGAALNLVRADISDPQTEIAVGFSEVATRTDDYFGAIIGRVANRIKDGKFSLYGNSYQVPINDNDNALHGGPQGFSTKIWQVESLAADAITLSLISPDGDQGFPGQLSVSATYKLFDTALRLDLTAETDAPTLCALTNHAYWNLAGSGSIDDHLFTVDADTFVPIDDQAIPLGALKPVDNTPFDLRTPTRIGEAIRAADDQIGYGHGIDHSFQINGSGFRRAARVEHPFSGRALEVWSDLPAAQIFTGNSFDGSLVKADGQRLRQGDAFAIEPQTHPDAPNQNWPHGNIELRPGQVWRARIEWRFTF